MRTNLKYGLITGIIVGAFAVGFFALINSLNTSNNWGMQPSAIRGIGGLLTIVILATGIYLTMQAIKKEQGNKLTYGQALQAGVIVAGITAVLVALFGFVYCQYLNPGYAQYMVSEGQKAMAANGETQQQIAEHSKALQAEFSTGGQVAQALIGQTIVGTVVSLIMGIFVKSKK